VIVPLSSPAEFASVDNIVILLVVILLVFGSTKIPKLARSLGSAQKEFKKGVEEGAADDDSGTKAVAQATPPAVVAPAPVVPAPPAAPTTVTVETNADRSPPQS
jgi:sec-independent protein translocase protein TatA